MRIPHRVTIALDDETWRILNELRDREGISQSEVVREALRFYRRYERLRDLDRDRVMLYIELLSQGEHIILDIDHWIAIMKLMENHPEKEKFWELHRDVARAHAEEFKGKNPEYVLKRLEACNFFRMSQKEGEYALIFVDELTKRFIKVMLEEIFDYMGIDAEIKEDLMKLRIKIGKRS